METVGGGGDGGANSLEEFVTSEIRRQTDQGGNNDAGDTEPAGGGQAEVFLACLAAYLFI